jgi:hypothetical protein
MLIPILIAAMAATAGRPETVEARVAVDRVAVLDEPRDTGYVVATLRKGDTARVRPAGAPLTGWLAIDPPGSVFGWVDASALKRPESDRERPDAALIRSATTVRSANPKAKTPGPPWAPLKPGDRVRLVDVPPLEAGGRRWAAVAPPNDRPCYIPADAVEWVQPAEPEIRPTAFAAADDDPELKRVDAMLMAETSGRPVEDWRLESIRSAYEALARQVGGDAERRRIVDGRLRQLEGLERASAAAKGFVEAASKSRELDRQFARLERRLEDAERERTRAFDAVGFVQPSARMHEGRKLFALIGLKDGVVSAYLDVPPGLDARSLTARRIGVRGAARYDPDLKARLISVRDLVDLEARE